MTVALQTLGLRRHKAISPFNSNYSMEPGCTLEHSRTAELSSSTVRAVADNAVTMPAILRLPRELRDLIYDQYVRIDGGYVHNFETNKLIQADGCPISLSLALTCRQIAAEMQGLALRGNAITFLTYFSESLRQQAGLFHGAVIGITHCKKDLLKYLIPRLLTSDMVKEATDTFPQFAQIFHGWTPHHSIAALHKQDYSCGEAPSTWDDLIHYVLDLLSKHPAFFDEANNIPQYWSSEDACNVLALNKASPELWLIPDPSEVSRLASIVHVEPRAPAYFARSKYSYSAASVALRFLYAIPVSCRNEVRDIILHEDWESVAHSESHGRGFIPLCQFNRHLHVQRVVSVWNVVFRVLYDHRADYVFYSEIGDDSDSVRNDCLYSSTITKAVGTWIAEAQALSSLGMPPESFSVLLDGNPTPGHTSTVFKVVQRDIAWQLALDAAYARGLLPTPSWSARRLCVGYQYEGLPAAIRNMSTNGGPISCNFDIGSPHDIGDLLALHRGWSLQEWIQNWKLHEPQSFQTEHPLPPWHVLRWLRVIA